MVVGSDFCHVASFRQASNSCVRSCFGRPSTASANWFHHVQKVQDLFNTQKPNGSYHDYHQRSLKLRISHENCAKTILSLRIKWHRHLGHLYMENVPRSDVVYIMYIHHTSIRNFVPWKTHRVHLICQTYGVRLIHQKNLKIPALDTKHSQRSLNQNPADGYLPKVVETQEVQRFSEFFFNCLKPSTLSCLKATSIKMYVDPLKEWFWVSNRHPFCPSRTDLGKSIRTSAQGNQGSMKAISPRCPNFGEKNGVYTGNKNTMAWLRHHARVKETHFLFTKSTETKNALSL